MLKNLAQLEHVVENKVCRFICDNDTPIHFVKEALFQFQAYIAKVEENIKAQQDQAKAQADAQAQAQEEPKAVEAIPES